MVGYASLGIIVGPYSFRTVPGTNLGRALGGAFLMFPGPFQIIKSGHQHLHCDFAIPVLRFLRASHDNASGQVGNSNCGIRFVYMLSARARTPHCVRSYVFGGNLDVHVGGLRQYRDSCRRCVNSPPAFSFGNALHSVNAALKLQALENPFSPDIGNDLPYTAQFGFAGLHDIKGPAFSK